MDNLYYIAPSDEIFEEVKQKAIEVWSQYDNEFGYVDEKVGRIQYVENMSDNLMYIVAMFDIENQSKLASKLSPEARLEIRNRLKAGGMPEDYIVF